MIKVSQRNQEMEKKLTKLENENFLLEQKIEHQKEVSSQLSQERALLEHELEVGMERQFHEGAKDGSKSEILNSLRRKTLEEQIPDLK